MILASSLFLKGVGAAVAGAGSARNAASAKILSMAHLQLEKRRQNITHARNTKPVIVTD
jgi:hypothetical protein